MIPMESGSGAASNPIAKEEEYVAEMQTEVNRLRKLLEERNSTIDGLRGLIARCHSNVCEVECEPDRG